MSIKLVRRWRWLCVLEAVDGQLEWAAIELCRNARSLRYNDSAAAQEEQKLQRCENEYERRTRTY